MPHVPRPPRRRLHRPAPRTSLGTTIFAAQFLDELWPVPLLLGLEQGRIVPGRMAASALDFVLLAAGLALYLRGTRARDRVGGWGLWAMDALAGGGLRR